MPRRDGTGPMGMGAMTGRGQGVCTGVNAPAYGGWAGRGGGRGCGRGFGRGLGRGQGPGLGRGFGFGAYVNHDYGQPGSKETLQAQREQLKAALDAIDQRLESL
ncbi:MAG: DUF5320 domain-containing protein [Syntrophomonadaceae bacterium]|nr:DUF5320 domain-containing protein [Syntrophomonadaceae bacterium]